jgi:tetratricopeptide (TPR) repeat protein
MNLAVNDPAKQAATLIQDKAGSAGTDFDHWRAKAQHLQDSGQLEEARAILLEAADRFPDASLIQHDLARLAEAKRDWALAEKHWRAFAAISPNVWWGPAHIANALLEQKRPYEAETLLAESLDRFPADVGIFVSYARAAERRRDWPEAATRWTVVAERFPSSWDGPAGQARVLREQRKVEDARILLTKAAERFPANAGPLHDRARLEEFVRDWPAAESAWRGFIALDPKPLWAHTALANALREQGRKSEAEATLRAQFEIHSKDATLFMDYARLAESDANWPEATARWEVVCQRFPHLPNGFLGLARAARLAGDFDKATAILQAAAKAFPTNTEIAVQSARLADARGLTTEADRHFRRAIATEPQNAFHYIHLALMHAGVADFVTADAVILQGMTAVGDHLHLSLEFARLAERRHDWPEATNRFRQHLATFPNDPTAILGLALGLAHQGQIQAAETILTDAIDRAPERVDLKITRIRLPGVGGPDRNKIYLRGALELQAELPNNMEVHRAVVDALMVNHRHRDAEITLRDGITRFPAEKALSHLLAIALVRQQKWEEAFDVFADYVARHPPHSSVMKDYADALTAARRWDDAKAVIRSAITVFPAAWTFDIAMIDILIAQGELTEAVSLWRSLQARPDASTELRRDLFERRTLLVGQGIDPAEALEPALLGADGEDIAVSDIVTSFESMGGSGLGCEFGLFQRHFGAEPLGLLRWTEMTQDQLVAALDAEFEGVGTPDQTILRTPEHGNHLEYGAADKRFGMMMHTFVRADQVPADKMFVQLCRRLSYLRGKFLDDLAMGGKIFVYKNAYRDLTEDEVMRLHKAVRRYGNATLLYVRREMEGKSFPLVEVAAPGLLIGYIDRFAFSPDGQQSSFPANSWGAIATEAYRIWRKTGATH